MAEHQLDDRTHAMHQSREEISRIAAAHGARNVRVFGSASRGEAGPASDLDLLVDMAEGRSLFDLIALSKDLEERLGVEVDVVTEASVSPYIRDRVLDEAVAL
jgi:predicted nucleotidyltransferase